MTLCAVRQTEHGNLASEHHRATLQLHGAAVGGAIISLERSSVNIISISAGALALTPPRHHCAVSNSVSLPRKKKKSL